MGLRSRVESLACGESLVHCFAASSSPPPLLCPLYRASTYSRAGLLHPGRHCCRRRAVGGGGGGGGGSDARARRRAALFDTSSVTVCRPTLTGHCIKVQQGGVLPCVQAPATAGQGLPPPATAWQGGALLCPPGELAADLLGAGRQLAALESFLLKETGRHLPPPKEPPLQVHQRLRGRQAASRQAGRRKGE